MHTVLVPLLFFFAPQNAQQSKVPREVLIQQQIEAIARSGRVVETGEARNRLEDPRKQIAPGAPPLLSFRYFQGADRHRFGNLDLVLDDAGH